MRYQFDGVNNLQIRQFVHRGGRADVFGFDTGERVAQAQMGVLLTNVSGAGPILYQRQYKDPTGPDFLTSTPPNGLMPTPPPFATNWSVTRMPSCCPKPSILSTVAPPTRWVT